MIQILLYCYSTNICLIDSDCLLFIHRHICDGTWHCLFGDDEYNCNQFHCAGLFVCAKCYEKECIHITDICNGAKDCCTGEDEEICNLQCPNPCKCLMYAAKCSSSLFENIAVLMSSKMTFLEFTKIVLTGHNFGDVHMDGYLLVLKWTKSHLKDICTSLKLNTSNLQYLDLSFNYVTKIKDNCFLLYTNLQILLLGNNLLTHIEIHAFQTVANLIKLDLSNNNLLELSAAMFSEINIYLINIIQNNFTIIDPSIEMLKTNMISTSDYRICCLMQGSGAVCLKKPKWPQSCNLMLNSKVVEMFCIILSTVIITFNIIAFSFGMLKHSRMKLKNQMQIQPTFRMNILCLHFNDLLFGIYLVAIFSAGKYYDRFFVIYAEQWLRGVLCKSCGLITSIALLNSLFLLTLISVSRFVAVRYPFNSHFRNMQFLIRYLLTGFLSTITFCVVIFFLYSAVELRHEMPSSTCLFLGETHNSKTIKCFTILVALLQFGSFISIIVLYSHIIKQYSVSDVRKSHGKAEKQVLSQALLVTLTNAITWLPSGIIYLISVTVEPYPISLLTWNAVLINPVNSLVNPLIFCIIPLVKQFQKTSST